jgi:fido (protein-threonine AMPylation protein)
LTKILYTKLEPSAYCDLRKVAKHSPRTAIDAAACDIAEFRELVSVVFNGADVIHPFREGNGRVARLLAVLMGLQTDLSPLFFDRLSGPKRQQYFAAVCAGLDREYQPMAEMFSAVIQRTLQIHGPC